MAFASKPTSRRIWRTPVSPARLFWLLCALGVLTGAALLYLGALLTQPFPGPQREPLRSLGIVALLLVLSGASYSLRRRFARHLPGKAQAWLWMHTWLSCAALLSALLHENFTHVLHDYCQNASCLTSAYGGTSALLALTLLVFSGLAGRLLDRWQARLIAREASSNGAGIVSALQERLLALEYQIERLCAGKADTFKDYCRLALEHRQVPEQQPVLDPREEPDFQAVHAHLLAYAHLAQSLARQQRARHIMRIWRLVHSALALLALALIVFHALAEIITNIIYSR